jgi:hypothetical protein
MTNNKNLGKMVKNQNHTCTIHRNTTHSFKPLGKQTHKFFLSVNWIYRTDEEYFLLNFFENNHQCVPFGLFITKINLLLLLIFFYH